MTKAEKLLDAACRYGLPMYWEYNERHRVFHLRIVTAIFENGGARSRCIYTRQAADAKEAIQMSLDILERNGRLDVTQLLKYAIGCGEQTHRLRVAAAAQPRRTADWLGFRQERNAK